MYIYTKMINNGVTEVNVEISMPYSAEAIISEGICDVAGSDIRAKLYRKAFTTVFKKLPLLTTFVLYMPGHENEEQRVMVKTGNTSAVILPLKGDPIVKVRVKTYTKVVFFSTKLTPELPFYDNDTLQRVIGERKGKLLAKKQKKAEKEKKRSEKKLERDLAETERTVREELVSESQV